MVARSTISHGGETITRDRSSRSVQAIPVRSVTARPPATTRRSLRSFRGRATLRCHSGARTK